MSFYWLFGLRTQNFFDCALVEKCIYAGAHSMKDYHFFSMEEMMARYFRVQIEKKYQESFTLDAELDGDQIRYAALDVRFPVAIRQVQQLILQGETYQSLTAKGNGAARRFTLLDPIITGDNLLEIARIENDAIGAFQDMHVHGERIDRERWLKRIAGKKAELSTLISNVLDPIFIPLVGNKTEIITEEQIVEAESTWKRLTEVSDAELAIKSDIRIAKKTDQAHVILLEQKRVVLEDARKQEKDRLKKIHSDLKKKRTKINNLVEKCEGNALINYASDSQLLAVLTEMKGLKKLTNLEDETLEKFANIPVMAAIRKYHGLAKVIGTYGNQWAMQWTTKPCKEEGWLHPGDGRLHCVFNQYDAETGRSSSEKPNGQNIEQDKEVRGCFIADPPDETIRVTNCCDADLIWVHGNVCCSKCVATHPETHAEEYVIVTADMSGAELRIIAELADDPVWIGAFERREDVHAVGAELLYEEEWPKLQLPDCAYYKLKANGEPQRKKCKCPEHASLRDGNKSTNFLLAYGGGPSALATAIKKTVEKARELMARHEEKNPRIWAYLEQSGRNAKTLCKAFDMFGRRRLFPKPDWDRARERVREYNSERLELKPEESERNIASFIAQYGRKPNKEEMWHLTHRQPTSKEISSAYAGMSESIGRQGKNHAIQGTNATIAKIAMGAGFCLAGKPYLWHTLPQYKAKLIKFVHDELVVQCPKQYGKQIADLIGDAFKRAAAEKMKRVVMEFEFNIASYWSKG